MKKTKSLIVVVAMVAVLVSAIAGTYAYFTDTSDVVVNTFTVGKVNIELSATKFQQPNLVPSAQFDLRPVVTVKAGSEPSYVRILLTISNYDELQKLYGQTVLLQNFVTDWDNTTWISTGVITENSDNTATYEFRYNGTPSAVNKGDEALPALFTKFTVPQELNNADLQTLSGLTITVEAHAIQAAGFNNADQAWAAFKVQHP